MASNILSATALINLPVRSTANEDLGTIEELMIDQGSGCVTFAVLSFDGLGSPNGKLFPVPWETLYLDINSRTFILNIARSTLENAPGFDSDHWPDMADREWGEEIYRYYGYEPYWSV